MLTYLKNQAIGIAHASIACLPSLLAMYLLYWLEKNDIWSAQTPLRDPISVCVVASGMILSLLIYSKFFTHRSR